MFNLFRSRDKLVRIMLGGLLLIVALSMLLYLIPGGTSYSGGGTDDQVVADIGGQQLTTREVDRAIQERIRGREIPAEMVAYVLPQIVDQMITEKTAAYEAQRMGFRVSDADLADTIRSLSPNINSMPPDQYKSFVQQAGFGSVPEFENAFREQRFLTDLQSMAEQSVVVTPQQVQAEFNRRNEKAKIEYILFDPAKLKSEVKTTPEDLKTFFNANHGSYLNPETRAFAMVVADPAKIAEGIQVADAQEHLYYNSHHDQYMLPERVHVRHILVSTAGKPKDEVPKIKAKAEELLKKIKSGGDFAALAKENSDDPGSKTNGGDLSWVARNGQMVKPFEDAVFALKAKEISGLVTTEYGFHIIEALERQAAHMQAFDEVKSQIVDQLRKETLNDKTQTLADQAQAQIAKNPKSAEEIANKLGLSYYKVDNYKAGDAMPLVGADKTIGDQAGTLKAGEVSPVMQAGNRLAVVVMDRITPAKPAEFAEVQDKVKSAYQQQKAVQVGADKAKQAADLLKSNGGDLKAAAKAVGAEVKTSDFFTRAGAVEGAGSATNFSDAFTKPAGSIIGPVNTGTANVVAKLVEKQMPAGTLFAAQRQGIVDELKGKQALERRQLIEDSILQKLVAKGVVKIHQGTINRILSRYRGTPSS